MVTSHGGQSIQVKEKRSLDLSLRPLLMATAGLFVEITLGKA